MCCCHGAGAAGAEDASRVQGSTPLLNVTKRLSLSPEPGWSQGSSVEGLGVLGFSNLAGYLGGLGGQLRMFCR